jgi:hypothetical protein
VSCLYGYCWPWLARSPWRANFDARGVSLGDVVKVIDAVKKSRVGLGEFPQTYKALKSSGLLIPQLVEGLIV